MQSSISVNVCEQFNMALLSVQSFNVGLGLECSSPAPPAWFIGCYLIVTKWRNTNIKSSTVNPVQPWGSGSIRKEPYTSWKAGNASVTGMSLSMVSKWTEWCIWPNQATTQTDRTNPSYNKSMKFCEQLEQIPRFSSCDVQWDDLRIFFMDRRCPLLLMTFDRTDFRA